MIEGKSTRGAGGLEITGTLPELRALWKAIGYVQAHGDLPERLGNVVLGLAYNVRKGYERLYGDHPDRPSKARGAVVVAWPEVLFQIVLLRNAVRGLEMPLEVAGPLLRLAHVAEAGLWTLGETVAVPSVHWLRAFPGVSDEYLLVHLSIATEDYLHVGPSGKQRAARLPDILYALAEDSPEYLRVRRVMEKKAAELGCSLHHLDAPPEPDTRPIRW